MSDTEGTVAAGIEAGRSGLPGWAVGAAVIITIVVIMVAYGYLSYLMLDYAKGSGQDLIWDRALLIFRSIEALAFAAAGVVLGVQIQRSEGHQKDRLVRRTIDAYAEKARAADPRAVNESPSQPTAVAIIKDLQNTINAIL